MSRNAGTESGGHASPEASEAPGADGLLQIDEVVVVEGMTVMSVENRLEASLVVVMVGFKLVLVGHIGVDLACFLGRGRNLHVCLYDGQALGEGIHGWYRRGKTQCAPRRRQ